MITFDEYITENHADDLAFEVYVEGLLDKALSWIGKKSSAAGQWLQNKAADPNSLLGPRGAEISRQKAGTAIQNFGRWVHGGQQQAQGQQQHGPQPQQQAAPQQNAPAASPAINSRKQVVKAIEDTKAVLKSLSKEILQSKDPKASQEFRDIYGKLDQILKIAKQREEAAEKEAAAAASGHPVPGTPASSMHQRNMIQQIDRAGDMLKRLQSTLGQLNRS